jgi:predicted transcriptional regulator
MVRSYRSRDEIVVEILKATTRRSRKTHIMQKANLNPLMFEKYFPMLLRNGYIVKEDGPESGSLYRLSDEGKVMLKMYRALHQRFDKKV